MSTKKQQIMALHARGKSTREIAAAVYGLSTSTPWREADRRMAYVRVVIRQRKGGNSSAHDVAWLMKTFGGDSLAEARHGQRAAYRKQAASSRKKAA